MITTAQVNSSLKSMISDLKQAKKSTKYLLTRIANEMPEAFMGAGEGDLSSEDTSNLGGAEMLGDESGGANGESGAGGENGYDDMKGGELGMEEKAPEIKTPEEAKKTLNEAVTDLKGVIDGIDNITEQGEDMEEKTASKTFRLSAKSQGEIGLLTKQAFSAINDAKSAVRHWAFLLKTEKSNTKSVGGEHEIVRNAKAARNVWSQLTNVFATAVPPTGAEFSGDKGINGDVNYAQKKEIKHFQAGNEEFHTDKAKEDKLPNAASEPRLTDKGNPHELGAYVNAKSVKRNNIFSSALVLRSLDKNKKNGKFSVITWDAAAKSLGDKTAANYEKFLSPEFAALVESHIRRNGIDTVSNFMGGQLSSIGLSKVAREPKVEDKAKLREYYKDAYGDAEFARELTSAQTKKAVDLGAGINNDAANAGAASLSDGDMNVEYKPEEESANAVPGGLEGGDSSDSVGSGKPMTEATLEVRRAQARAAVDFARLAASRNLIPFTKTAIAAKAREVVAFSEAKYAAQKELLDSMALVNESALKEARIPDDSEVESGILANTREAVTEPQNKSVSTEGVASDVSSDGKIAQASKRTANVVPQLQTTGGANNKVSFANSLNTIANRLRAKGIDPSTATRRVKATYRPK